MQGDIYLQSFQYKIVNRIIACRHWLFNQKVIESPDCRNCNEDDTLQHFFIYCNTSEQFWNSFITWWNNLAPDLPFPADERVILFGYPIYTDLSQIFKFCLIFAKWYIYRTKMSNEVTSKPLLYSFLKELKEKVELEYVYFKTINKLNKFRMKWGFLHDNL